MKVDISNPQQIMSHILLCNTALVDKVVSTKEWTELDKLTGELTVNGVTVSAQVLEDALQTIFYQIEEHFKEKYDVDKFDEHVEQKAKQLLKEHANDALNVLSDLSDKLHEAEDLLVPHWERNK